MQNHGGLSCARTDESPELATFQASSAYQTMSGPSFRIAELTRSAGIGSSDDTIQGVLEFQASSCRLRFPTTSLLLRGTIKAISGAISIFRPEGCNSTERVNRVPSPAGSML